MILHQVGCYGFAFLLLVFTPLLSFNAQAAPNDQCDNSQGFFVAIFNYTDHDFGLVSSDSSSDRCGNYVQVLEKRPTSRTSTANQTIVAYVKGPYKVVYGTKTGEQKVCEKDIFGRPIKNCKEEPIYKAAITITGQHGSPPSFSCDSSIGCSPSGSYTRDCTLISKTFPNIPKKASNGFCFVITSR